jgi:hypothetical protein
VAISFIRSEDDKNAKSANTDETVLEDILGAYPGKLHQMPLDLTTLDKF